MEDYAQRIMYSMFKTNCDQGLYLGHDRDIFAQMLNREGEKVGGRRKHE